MRLVTSSPEERGPSATQRGSGVHVPAALRNRSAMVCRAHLYLSNQLLAARCFVSRSALSCSRRTAPNRQRSVLRAEYGRGWGCLHHAGEEAILVLAAQPHLLRVVYYSQACY